MKKKIIVGLIAIVAIMVLGTVPTLAAEPTLPPGYTWYEDEEFKFKIGYPEDWRVVPEEEKIYGEGMLGGAMFQYPDTPNTIAVNILDSECDIEKLKAMGAQEVVINGREGYDVIFQPLPIVTQRLVHFPVDERCYFISCSTEVELFDEYAAKFDTAINSFVIEYPAPVTPAPTPKETETATPMTITTPSTTPTPPSTPTPTIPEGKDIVGFEAVFAVIGFLAVAYLVLVKKRR